MIWRAVPASVSVPEAEALAQHFATQPTETFGLLKQALTASTTNDLSTQLDLERDLQRKAAQTRDFAEGLRAFLEKRLPTFTGGNGGR